jgi:membrane associated rhomboid family serine protease
MGLYDRDYLQGEYQHRPAGGGARMMVTNLLILNVAVFLLSAFVGKDPATGTNRVVQWLALTPPDLLKPWLWWRLLTCGFVHSTTDIGHIFWNMFGLFIFGRDVELRYGRAEFLRFYLVAIVLGALAWGLRLNLMDFENARLLGASGGVAAVILLFVYNFPRRTILLFFVLPVPAWVLGLIMVLGDAMGFVGGGSDAVAFDVHLIGVAFASAYFWFGWRLGGWTPESIRGRIRWPRWRSRPKLRIHDPEAKDERQEQEADRILAKVSREGIDSLTAKERRILEEYSRRMRQKRS